MNKEYCLVVKNIEKGIHSVLPTGKTGQDIPVIGMSNSDLNHVSLTPEKDYELEPLKEKISKVGQEPLSSAMLGSLSGYLGSYPNVETIYEHLKSLYGESLPQDSIKIKILFSLANYIVRKNLGQQYLSILQGRKDLRLIDGYELNQLGLVILSDSGFVWRPAKKLLPRHLEVILEKYANETNIPLEDALEELKKTYRKEDTKKGTEGTEMSKRVVKEASRTEDS